MRFPKDVVSKIYWTPFFRVNEFQALAKSHKPSRQSDSGEPNRVQKEIKIQKWENEIQSLEMERRLNVKKKAKSAPVVVRTFSSFPAPAL